MNKQLKHLPVPLFQTGSDIFKKPEVKKVSNNQNKSEVYFPLKKTCADSTF